jgi:hypothetical protein
VPPKILLFGVAPMLLTIILLFITKKGGLLLTAFLLKTLLVKHYKNTVELVLLELFIHKAVPQLMTFEGRNFDVLSGITAPFGCLLWIYKKGAQPENYFSLEFYLSCITRQHCELTPFYQHHFFYNGLRLTSPILPSYISRSTGCLPFIVPVVLFGHLVSIRQLIRSQLNQITSKAGASF